jgi:acetoin utilization deacetylase AcuC-like enzyme
MGLPPEHRFPARKYRLVRDQLDRFELCPSPLADPAAIELVHDAEYVRSFIAGSVTPAVMRRIGFPWSAQLVDRTLASVGGTMAAAVDAMESGFGGVLAGGTHHAFHAEGAGFCVFNDIAVAIADLRKRGLARRFAVIDLDVHQGDGTAQIFEGDSNVFTLSVHGRNNFPFRKQTSSVDVALEDNTADLEYLHAVDGVLPRVFEFEPDVVFYQSGVDGLEQDALGKLSLTLRGLEARDHLVMEQCREFGKPFVVTMGGGYANPIELTAEAHANTFRIAGQYWQ